MSDLRAYWLARGVIPRWQYLLVYVLIVTAGAAGITQTQRLAHRADNLARDIQQQRIATIRASCEQQNMSYDRIDVTLARLFPNMPADTRRQLDGAIAPKRDCEKVVAEATRTP